MYAQLECQCWILATLGLNSDLNWTSMDSDKDLEPDEDQTRT